MSNNVAGADAEATTGSAPLPAALDVRKQLTAAWTLFAAEPGAWILATGVLLLGGALSCGLLFAPLVVGMLQMLERQRRGEPIRVGQLFDGLERFTPALFAGLAIGASVAVGTLAMVIPGVVLAVMWSTTLHFVARGQLGALAALRASWGLVRRHVGVVLLALLTALGLIFLGSLVVLGLLVTVPLSLIFFTLCFDELGR